MKNRVYGEREEYADLADDGRRWPGDLVSRGRSASEGFSDQVGEFVARSPALCVGVGLTLGVLLGCMIKRR